MNIIQSPSPNFSKSSYKKIGWQIHKTLGLMPGTLEWLQNPVSQSSSHKLVTKSLNVHELVNLEDRPWSAGVFNNPSARARKILKRDPIRPWRWLAPGYYLGQIEIECLLNERVSQGQIDLVIQIMNESPIMFRPEYLLTHQDTADYKPNLEWERSQIIKGMLAPVVVEDKREIKDAIHLLVDKL